MSGVAVLHPWPRGATLDGASFLQLKHMRVLRSNWWLQARKVENCEAGLIGFGLWLSSLTCDPAGVLPVDDEALCDLAGLGTDLERWRRLRPFALYGWVPCRVALEVDAGGMPDPDGEVVEGLWHPEVHAAAEVAMRATGRKRAASSGRDAQRVRQNRKTVRDGLLRHNICRGEPPTEAVEWIDDWCDRDGLYRSVENLRAGWVAWHSRIDSEVAKLGQYRGAAAKALAGKGKGTHA